MWAIGEPARRRVHAKRALRRATHRRNAKHRAAARVNPFDSKKLLRFAQAHRAFCTLGLTLTLCDPNH